MSFTTLCSIQSRETRHPSNVDIKQLDVKITSVDARLSSLDALESEFRLLRTFVDYNMKSNDEKGS